MHSEWIKSGLDVLLLFAAVGVVNNMTSEIVHAIRDEGMRVRSDLEDLERLLSLTMVDRKQLDEATRELLQAVESTRAALEDVTVIRR